MQTILTLLLISTTGFSWNIRNGQHDSRSTSQWQECVSRVNAILPEGTSLTYSAVSGSLEHVTTRMDNGNQTLTLITPYGSVAAFGRPTGLNCNTNVGQRESFIAGVVLNRPEDLTRRQRRAYDRAFTDCNRVRALRNALRRAGSNPAPAAGSSSAIDIQP